MIALITYGWQALSTMYGYVLHVECNVHNFHMHVISHIITGDHSSRKQHNINCREIRDVMYNELVEETRGQAMFNAAPLPCLFIRAHF
jgi:hypothetical protein